MTHRYTAGSRSSGVVARTARKTLMSMRVIAWRLLSAEMPSNVAARKANGTRAPGAQVASALRSKSACSAAAATAPVPTPSTCAGQLYRPSLYRPSTRARNRGAPRYRHPRV